MTLADKIEGAEAERLASELRACDWQGDAKVVPEALFQRIFAYLIAKAEASWLVCRKCKEVGKQMAERWPRLMKRVKNDISAGKKVFHKDKAMSDYDASYMRDIPRIAASLTDFEREWITGWQGPQGAAFNQVAVDLHRKRLLTGLMDCSLNARGLAVRDYLVAAGRNL